MPAVEERKIVPSRLLVSLLLVAAVATPPATPASPPLPAGVHVIAGAFTPGVQPDGNTVILDAPAGLIVVDTGRHRAHTEAVLAHAARVGRPIVAVVNTHWHLDHVGGNPRIRRVWPDVQVLASGALAEALRGFLADYRRVLVAGDLVTLPVPLLDTPCPARWLDALDRLAAQDFAVVVPGHGPPLDRADFAAYHAAFVDLLANAAIPRGSTASARPEPRR